MAGAATLDTPVHAIMSAPLVRIPESALIYEALMRMEEQDVRHLAVEDGAGEIVGVIDTPRWSSSGATGRSCCSARSRAPPRCESGAALRACRPAGRQPDRQQRPPRTGHQHADLDLDTATERLIELAVDELGPPPAAFAFIAMGSQGRGELTLLTDQDNGIIFATARGADSDGAEDYYGRLGAMVRDGLRESGYPLCGGQVMASEPKWCRSLSAWLSARRMDGRAEPQDIADLSVLLDVRGCMGMRSCPSCGVGSMPPCPASQPCSTSSHATR